MFLCLVVVGLLCCWVCGVAECWSGVALLAAGCGVLVVGLYSGCMSWSCEGGGIWVGSSCGGV